MLKHPWKQLYAGETEPHKIDLGVMFALAGENGCSILRANETGVEGEMGTFRFQKSVVRLPVYGLSRDHVVRQYPLVGVT